MFAFGPVPPTPPVLWKLIGQEQKLVEGRKLFCRSLLAVFELSSAKEI